MHCVASVMFITNGAALTVDDGTVCGGVCGVTQLLQNCTICTVSVFG